MNLIATQIYRHKPFSSFVSTWNTANISTGSSTATQVKLPLFNGGIYNFVVNWGDGSSSTITAYNAAAVTHTYSVSGTYIITITGVCAGWQFNNTGDRLKILSISSWGILKLGTAQGAYFYGCANLTLSTVTDTLDLTITTDLNRTFRGCTAITTINKFTDWKTNLVTNFREIFLGCTNFNQDVGALNVSSAFNLDSFFMNCTNFNNAGSNSINNWNVSNVDAYGSSGQGIFAGCTKFNQPLGNWNVSNTSIFLNMFNGATIFNQDLSTWNVSKGTNFNGMFNNASAFNNGLASGVAGTMTWNTSSATDMGNVFKSAIAFNQDIGAWNVSKVATFYQMFHTASKFNNGGTSNINNWVIRPTGADMNGVFQSAIAFNQNISSWNVSAVWVMQNMFYLASSFNQNISSWNTGSVNNMLQMFSGATAFNNGLASGVAGTMTWNTSAVTTMLGMFQSAVAFNQDIGSWNTSAVTFMNSMFQGALKFNQNIGGWDVSNVTIMGSAAQGMFLGATAFNNGGSSSINGWNVSKVTSMGGNNGGMFRNASAFNQDISGWNTSAVTNMSSMFQGAVAFNQNIGSWNVSLVTNFGSFMIDKTAANFSTTNLDAIYNGWSSRPVKPSIEITFGFAKYTAASSAGRAILTSAPNLWGITDGLI